MIGRLTACAALGALLGAPAWAQDQKVEVSGSAGWTFSDGVSSKTPIRAADGVLYNRVDPKDSFSWNAGAAYFLNELWAVEFLYGQQQSKLTLGGTKTTELGDYSIKNYHGVFSYHMGEPPSTARPFFFFGAGVTDFPTLKLRLPNGDTGEIRGRGKFSSTVGLGIKIYPTKRVGLRLQARWTSTYIKSDTDGFWCNPFFGCYLTEDLQFSNQFEATGGLTLRF